MNDDDKTTDRMPPAGYTLTSTPADPYVGAVLSLLMLVVMLLGGLPDDLTAAELEHALEAVAGGGTVLFGLAAALWRRRVQRGNVLR